MYTNNNLLRNIINTENSIGANEWSFTPSFPETINTGLLTVTVKFDSTAKSIATTLNFLGDVTRDVFFTDLGYVIVGGINFGVDELPVLTDETITITKTFSDAKYDSELLAFINTLSIEVGVKHTV